METQNQESKEDNVNDKLDTGLTILSACIPIAGAIIYFNNKEKSPNKAKSACTAALVGLGIGVLLNIIVATLGGR
jgi:NO-binding membrane sensor protein with MHYT domain